MTRPHTLDRRGVTWGAIAVAIALVLVVFGSAGLRWFDAALVGYLFGTLFACSASSTGTRCGCAARRPRCCNRRGWEAFRAADRAPATPRALPALVGAHLLAQTFIRRRSRARWLAHQLVFWGCILAALVTFPLVLGLLHFESVGQQRPPLPGVRRRPVGTRELRQPEHRRLDHLPPPRHRGGAGAGRRVHLPAPPAPRPRRAGGRAQRTTSSRSPGCSRCR